MEYKAIKPSELRVGDVFAAMFRYVDNGNTRLFTDVVATSVYVDLVEAEGLNFWTKYNTFYLIERPKKPLPTAIGSVVEVDGVKYVRVMEDSKWYYEWVKSLEGYTPETVSSEWLAKHDFTVV